MEYIFGTSNDIETLETIGDVHSNLNGFHAVKYETPLQEVTDRFRIVHHLSSKEDKSGLCYDWYEIDSHYRYIIEKDFKNQEKDINSSLLDIAEITDENVSGLLELADIVDELKRRVEKLEGGQNG